MFDAFKWLKRLPWVTLSKIVNAEVYKSVTPTSTASCGKRQLSATNKLSISATWSKNFVCGAFRLVLNQITKNDDTSSSTKKFKKKIRLQHSDSFASWQHFVFDIRSAMSALEGSLIIQVQILRKFCFIAVTEMREIVDLDGSHDVISATTAKMKVCVSVCNCILSWEN